MIANNNKPTQRDDFGGTGFDQHVFPQDCALEAMRTQGRFSFFNGSSIQTLRPGELMVAPRRSGFADH
jgi:hypothetical protein